mgnify:CR=1 FL=1
MTDVARPCLLDRDQVASVDVVMMVNRGGVVYDRRTKKDNRKLNDVNKGMKDYAKYKLVVGILVVTIIIVLYFIQHTT